ncbi:thiopeptide-type bacteriocin biosynthesis protein [Cryptosporangium sp. NPDC048952]|uniref:thiopeptide-type bacteriocin biosynthesis protein n=1 Tax=Cryptosporangium sp. NPDC048952 TaxID=3363961 RepID=UPI00371054E7
MRDLDDLTIHPAPPSPWHQINVRVPDEQTGAARLAAVMGEARANGLINAWFFIRKGQWRVRFRPTAPSVAEQAHAAVLGELADLRRPGDVADARGVAYEPETYAFGGPVGMENTHRLWHADSHHIVNYLAGLNADGQPDRRREISILLLSAMLRAAGLDWYEQGDVWARVADEDRPLDPAPTPEHLDHLVRQMRQLMLAETIAGSIMHTASWLAAFTDAGQAFTRHSQRAELTRGLRRVLGHQFIFHWNRLGLTARKQALLTAAARNTVLDG